MPTCMTCTFFVPYRQMYDNDIYEPDDCGVCQHELQNKAMDDFATQADDENHCKYHIALGSEEDKKRLSKIRELKR